MIRSLFTISMASAILIFSSCGETKVDQVEEELPVESSELPQEAVVSEAIDPVPLDTITTGSGLKYIILQEGDGVKPQKGEKVVVHYAGFLTDGTKFDSSFDRNEPIEFNLGTGSVIEGWDEGIALLNTGSKARLIIPHELGYGTSGYSTIIPPEATLIFDVELIAIK